MSDTPKYKQLAPGICIDNDALLQLRALAQDIKLDAQKPSASTIEGSARSPHRGRGMEFSEVRIYQPGDDIRTIDWRVTARTQETYTKLFQQERDRPVYLVVDQRSSMFFGSKKQFKSVMAAKIASLIAWAAFNNRDKVGAIIFDEHEQRDLRAKQGKFALLRFVHELAEANTTLYHTCSNHSGQDTTKKAVTGGTKETTGATGTPSATDTAQPQPNTQDTNGLSSVLDEVHRIARPGTLVYVISDFHDYSAACTQSLSALSKHNSVELVHIYDLLEATLPKLGTIKLSSTYSNQVNARTLSVNTNDGSFRRRYSDQWEEHLVELQYDAMQFGMGLHSFDTTLSEFDVRERMFYARKRAKARSQQ